MGRRFREPHRRDPGAVARGDPGGVRLGRLPGALPGAARGGAGRHRHRGGGAARDGARPRARPRRHTGRAASASCRPRAPRSRPRSILRPKPRWPPPSSTCNAAPSQSAPTSPPRPRSSNRAIVDQVASPMLELAAKRVFRLRRDRALAHRIARRHPRRSDAFRSRRRRRAGAGAAGAALCRQPAGRSRRGTSSRRGGRKQSHLREPVRPHRIPPGAGHDRDRFHPRPRRRAASRQWRHPGAARRGVGRQSGVAGRSSRRRCATARSASRSRSARSDARRSPARRSRSRSRSTSRW